MNMQRRSKSVFTRRESGARSYCRAFDTIFTSAQGSEMVDCEGRRYIDFLAGCSSLNYGHNDPDMKAALVDHICRDGLAHGLDLHTGTKAEFIQAFEEHVLQPRGLNHRLMFTGPTGANAVEAALKIARKATGRTNVIAFTNGFHGVTLGALAATGNAYHRGGGGLPLANVTHMPFDGYAEGLDSVGLLRKMLCDASSGLDAPAAFLLETVQGEGGLNVSGDRWLADIATLARETGALMIVDDIQAGCGRTTGFFSFERAGITPDIITLAKSISGFGLPMSLVLVRPEYDVLGPAEHNGTFRGNTHAFITARIAIEKFWAGGRFEKDIRRRSGIVERGLQKIAALVPGARLKGLGMMQGVDVGSGDLAAAICRAAFRQGLIIETSGPDDQVVKVLAPLTTPDEMLEAGLSILIEATRHAITAPRIAAE
ncbi:diaminobutyrate--2-oxoglutarate transaminase [Thalassococcus sp. S3]|uniref:diaminobutyrate--2-oxoglutarate transaminase n=1 Tax=Thalassococcus sp. S3 TaxID=2017482 RepID=UPI00102469D7|nr:diaminobutyrate--2-oxoglutarate transaminase [Thalassococcus sp. S3]QBF29897.1 diaminobutyrate--2-oxoglutarate transaminase [Thalassococcus sp. S3]